MSAGWRAGLERAWYRGATWLVLLQPLAWCYQAVASARRQLYTLGVLPRYRAPVPVIVIGNLTPGGTGKTAVVIALAQYLRDAGVAVGVVSRGYGSTSTEPVHAVSSDSRAEDCGDEALVIFRRTGVPVVTGRSRTAAIRSLLAHAPVDIILSDDGLQHYAMARDVEVVLYDQQSGFGNGRCLPAGPLREPLSRLAQVDLVLDRGARDSGAQVWYEPLALVHLLTGERRAVSAAAYEAPVVAVAGLGRPQQFVDQLEAAGFRCQARLFPDHHRFVPADFADLAGQPVIMTEKDAVKCTGPGFDAVLQDAWYLQVEARLPERLQQLVLAQVRP